MIIAIGIIIVLCIIRAKAESAWALTLLGIAALAVGAYLSYSLEITGPIIPILAACVVILLPMLFSSGSSSSSDNSSSYSSTSSSSSSYSSSSSSSSYSGANSSISMDNPAVCELVNEAVEVVNDFLNIGSTASLFTLSYNGFLSCLCVSGPNNTYRFKIMMFDAPSLNDPSIRNSNMCLKNPEIDRKVAIFALKYGRYYVSSEKRYKYDTKKAVTLKQKSTNANELNALLYQQISQRCPLAENISNDGQSTQIYTKTVPRG